MDTLRFPVHSDWFKVNVLGDPFAGPTVGVAVEGLIVIAVLLVAGGIRFWRFIVKDTERAEAKVEVRTDDIDK